ncbi:MAG TPA: FAH family protein, partial [Chloroflexia bacterium]|nr:FAH family protein [Chloroflexia bacterium]
MIRLVQFVDEGGQRRVGVSSDAPDALRLIAGYERVYDLARAAIRAGQGLEALARENLAGDTVDYGRIIAERRLLAPLDHPDPAHCIVSLTGLTHLGSAKSRDQMHTAAQAQTPQTDSMRMFAIGLEGGRPAAGQIGAEPEWAYKGDGRCIVPPECPLPQPAYARDGGEEAEIAGLYVIGEDGAPWRVGYALGNEFAD